MKKASWFYIFMKVLVRFTLKLFFKKIEIQGLENVPKNAPLIFASNHQGTLMDGVLLIITSNFNIASLVRADVFKKPIIKWILQKFMLVPIYRPRDGGNPLEKNQEVFKDCFQFLKEKGAITIFPESGNGMEWYLRSFKKGVSRIALGAESQNRFNLNLHIIPTSIHYHNHTKFRSEIVMNFGTPIKGKDYYELYQQNKNKAIKQLTAKVKEGILQNLVHIPDFENHHTIKNWLLYKANDDRYRLKIKQTVGQKIGAMQKRINKLMEIKANQPAEYQIFLNKVKDYTGHLTKNNFKDWQFARKPVSLGVLFFYFMMLFILSPLWVYSFVNCIISYCVIKTIIKKIGLPAFYLNALKSFLGLFIGGFIFAIQAIIVWTLFNNFWLSLLYFISLPLAGIFWYNYNVWLIKFRSLVKYNQTKKTINVTKAAEARNLIISGP